MYIRSDTPTFLKSLCYDQLERMRPPISCDHHVAFMVLLRDSSSAGDVNLRFSDLAKLAYRVNPNGFAIFPSINVHLTRCTYVNIFKSSAQSHVVHINADDDRCHEIDETNGGLFCTIWIFESALLLHCKYFLS